LSENVIMYENPRLGRCRMESDTKRKSFGVYKKTCKKWQV